MELQQENEDLRQNLLCVLSGRDPDFDFLPTIFSPSELAVAFNLNESTINSRKYRGYSWEQILTSEKKFDNQARHEEVQLKVYRLKDYLESLEDEEPDYEFIGETYSMSAIAQAFDIKRSTISMRRQRGWDWEKTLTTKEMGKTQRGKLGRKRSGFGRIW